MGRIKLLIGCSLLLPAAQAIAGASCTYDTWRWHSQSQTAVAHQQVVKPYAELSDEERDRRSGCSVCREDQREVRLPGIAPFSLCHRYAVPVTAMLRKLIAAGVPIKSVTGYRVGRTRGALDNLGRRTGFSNHSYGIALDINEAANGLYSDCVTFHRRCRLLRGGPWMPGRNIYSLTPQSPLVRGFAALGFKWGGKIAGQQKDFMHFSPTGY